MDKNSQAYTDALKPILDASRKTLEEYGKVLDMLQRQSEARPTVLGQINTTRGSLDWLLNELRSDLELITALTRRFL